MSEVLLCPFLTMQWVGLQLVIVAFPSHAHFFYGSVGFMVAA